MSLLDIYNARKKSKEEGKSQGEAPVGSLLEIYKQRTGQEGGATAKKKPTTDRLYDTTPVYDSPAAAAGATMGKWISDLLHGDKDDERTWFQKGAFESGVTADNAIKAFQGTSYDTATDVGAGFLGFGEKAVDWFVGQAPNAILTQAQGQYDTPAAAAGATLGKIIANIILGKDISYDPNKEIANTAAIKAKKEAADFIKKDLYDEKKLANNIISRLGSAAFLAMKTQSGQQITQQDIKWANTMQQDTLNYINGDMEKDSILGDKSDSLMQSAGQLGATAMLSAMKVPWWVATGVSSWGGEMENALNNGATLEQANVSGLISATAEVLTERISGGIKLPGMGKTLDDALTSTLATNISSKFWRTAAKLGIDTSLEGVEEWVSQDISTFGQWLTYQNEEDLWQLLTSEEAMDAKIEAFLGGMALGGAGSTTQSVIAKMNGVDYTTGLTKNEETVVNKVYEDELAQREKSGKLSAGEKTKLYDSVVKNMEQGRISTDTIESVLGGDTYKGYQSLVEQEKTLTERQKALQTEINALQGADNTIGNNRKLQKAESELEEVTEKLKSLDVKSAKSNLFSHVDKLTANDTKLRESYNERTRRGQAFAADLTKYDAKQQETVKRAIESGILNNTNRTHEFVDLIARISANKGVSFNFADNAKLKESGFAIDGKQVNGFVTADGITININSAKALNSVVGHEITHVLEGTELYNELQSAITEYAKSKGDYQGRYDTLTELYKDIEGADIDAELTADLVGDYLFTDADFVQRLSTEHRGVFQKLFDEIKHLCKLATAGTKEARELEKVKKLFEDAYRTETKNPTADGGVKYSITEGMTDAERYAELKDKNIEVAKVQENAILDSYDIEGKSLNDIFKFIRENRESLGLNKVYQKDEIQLEFGYSNRGIKKSIRQTADSKVDEREYLDILSCLDQIIDTSVLIERHSDKSGKQNTRLKQVYVLLGALQKNGVVTPVQLEIKESVDADNQLYLAVAIKKSGVNVTAATEVASVTNPDFSVISIHELIEKINPDAKDFLKYIPDDFLTPEQMEGKKEGIRRDIEKYPNSPFRHTNSGTEGSVEGKLSLSGEGQTAAHAGGYRITGEDIALAPTEEDIAEQGIATAQTAPRNDVEELGAPTREDILQMEAKKGSLEEVLAEGASIRSQLRNNQEVLNAMQPVAEIQTPAEYEQMDITEKKKWVEEKLSPTGYKVERKGFGIIDFAKKRLKSAFNYFDKNSVEEASFEAIPFVLENGVEIENRNVHKDRNYGTVTIAAPITINGIRGNMAVVVKQTNGNYYKVHRVLTPDGSVFHLPEMTNEAESTPAGESPINGSLATPKDSASVISIPDNGEVVNGINNDTQEITAPTREDIMRMEAEKELHGPWRMVDELDQRVEKLYRMMLREEVSEEDYVAQLVKADRLYQQRGSKVEEALERVREAYNKETAETPETEKKMERLTRKVLHKGIMERIKEGLAKAGFDLNTLLKNAKNLSTFATVDNTPQRVNEKTFGYKAGQIINDLTVNKAALNESDGIQWLNGQIDKIKKMSERYGIKPGSKENRAAQIYGEGFWVNEVGEYIQYGDAELAADFPDTEKQAMIKALAKSQEVRQMYDDTLDAINAARVRNGYPPIPRRDNYFLHFRAQDDTFSRIGVPFNPNDVRAKDLPTDLNGVTADLKPGKPFFASEMHRTGDKTTYDLIGGLERYMNSAKNQIYHIDDIQTLRAMRNYIADMFGQANGLADLDSLSPEEQEQRIKEVFDNHLSTYAKFLNEEANIFAGKTALIDRGVEGVLGRRAIQFLHILNGQVGKNMVGYNISSAGTNVLPVVQATAMLPKADMVKAFAQTISNKFRNDGFVESDPALIRRRGADQYAKTPWQRISDPGYALMGAVDNLSSELIVRAKYNELTRKGMDSQQAHVRAGEWASRLMGDRSLGQMPQLYNSKTLGLITKFQLEVRNQLDAMGYDVIQEAKAEEGTSNAKKAAKVASTMAQLAIFQHLFGQAYESIAGYNPTFDIVENLIKLFGFDDEEESEDTFGDNVEQAFLGLLEDLPYTSTFTGGRIPIASALPVKEVITGKDSYGNEKDRIETLAEALPYYVLPGGYGQAKKTVAGLKMFDEDLPVAGSYTESGNLRFPVEEDSIADWLQAALFGQYASKNAREYFDNGWAPLKEKQIEEFASLEIPIADYREIRKQLGKLNTLGEKFDYIDSLNLTVEQKNILVNNVVDRKEPVDMTDYAMYEDFEEFDFYIKNQEKYQFLKANGIAYKTYNASEESRAAYNWAFQNPEKYQVSRAITEDTVTYKSYTKALSEIKADKDSAGNAVSGSRKKKVVQYINGLDAEYGAKLVLYKLEYPSDNTYNGKIIEYVNGIEEFTFEQKANVLGELGFTVTSDGRVTWN